MTSHTDDPLTPQEHRIMKLVAQGEQDGQIAGQLQISPRTVTNHVRSACQKLKTRNRVTAAVSYYQCYGIPEWDARPMIETEPLTLKEQRVIMLVAQGQTNKEVAAQLGLSPLTVGQHLETLRRKFDVPNRLAAAVEYYRLLVLWRSPQLPEQSEEN